MLFDTVMVKSTILHCTCPPLSFSKPEDPFLDIFLHADYQAKELFMQNYSRVLKLLGSWTR